MLPCCLVWLRHTRRSFARWHSSINFTAFQPVQPVRARAKVVES